MSHSIVSGAFFVAGTLAVLAASAFMSNDDYHQLVDPVKKTGTSARTNLPKCSQIQQDYMSPVSIPCIR